MVNQLKVQLCELINRSEELQSQLAAKVQESEAASQDITSLKAENDKLRGQKEEAEVKWATANSLVAGLERRNADLEACYNQVSAESGQKDAVITSLQEKLEQQASNFALQLAAAKADAVVEFKKSELFEENMVLLQGPVLQMGQTKAIDICAEVCPKLNKEDPRLVEFYNSHAEAEFEAQFQKFTDGADLREDEEQI